VLTLVQSFLWKDYRNLWLLRWNNLTKSILIEPGLIKTNFDNNLKIGKSVSSNPNSPYAEITQERLSGFKPRFEQGSSAIEVAKVILKAITSENPPKLRYLVGDDAFKFMEIEKIVLTQSLEN
jgi:hypothetical protein